jgi:hypothetical protein
MYQNAEPLLRKIAQMNDFQVLRFFDYFSNGVLNGLSNSLRELFASMPAAQQITPELLAIRQLGDTTAAEPMPTGEAAQTTRTLLESWAKDENLAPLLENALAQYRDTEQSALAILAIGTAVSMVLLSAGQARFQVEAFGVKISFGGKNGAAEKTLAQTLEVMPATTKRLLEKAKPSPIIQLLTENKVKAALDLLETSTPTAQLQDVYLLKARYSNWAATEEEGRFLSAEARIGEQNQIFAAIIDFSLNLL